MARQDRARKPGIDPLLVRPGAHFTCVNDGLCCTDIHALGPITKSEAKAMRKLSQASVAYNDDIEDLCLAASRDGGCHFRVNGLCEVHAQHGAGAKPAGCRRFPYGLVATPDGGRITTEHRCPCRTLGTRPPIDLDDAVPSLKDEHGEFEIDQEAGRRIPLTEGRSVPWADYVNLEGNMLERLAAGEQAEAVLDKRPFPDLAERSWPVYAAEFFDMRDGTAGGEALVWFGDALLALTAGHAPPTRDRPWAPFFARALARCERPGDPEAMYNDWVGDELWMFRWLEWGPFDVGRAELATRLAIARKLQSWLEEIGLRADQAVAEALMVVEIATVSSEWPKAVEDIV
ncbi:MAG: hypothetical protein OXU20_29915 [Myxococcales bacterium]|nr:hypothetical protein [Myxococcales bacterium]MDD9969339.1 hypothetical protein [Myxococcales bacterium]